MLIVSQSGVRSDRPNPFAIRQTAKSSWIPRALPPPRIPRNLMFHNSPLNYPVCSCMCISFWKWCEGRRHPGHSGSPTLSDYMVDLYKLNDWDGHVPISWPGQITLGFSLSYHWISRSWIQSLVIPSLFWLSYGYPMMRLDGMNQNPHSAAAGFGPSGWFPVMRRRRASPVFPRQVMTDSQGTGRVQTPHLSAASTKAVRVLLVACPSEPGNGAKGLCKELWLRRPGKMSQKFLFFEFAKVAYIIILRKFRKGKMARIIIIHPSIDRSI